MLISFFPLRVPPPPLHTLFLNLHTIWGWRGSCGVVYIEFPFFKVQDPVVSWLRMFLVPEHYSANITENFKNSVQLIRAWEGRRKGFNKQTKTLNLWQRSNRRGGVSGLVVIVLRFFFCLAPNLFVLLKEAPKHILWSLQTPYSLSLPSYLTL